MNKGVILMKKNIGLRMSDALYQDLKYVCDNNEKTVTETIETLVSDYVFNEGRKQKKEIDRVSILLEQSLPLQQFDTEEDYDLFLERFLEKTIQRLSTEKSLRITMPFQTLLRKLEENYSYERYGRR